MSNTYRSEVGRYGIAKQAGKWLFTGDRVKGRLFGAPSTVKVDSWRYGVDYSVSPTWTIRGGSFDRQPTAGFTYKGEDGRLLINYAYVRNISDDELNILLGNSNTQALTLSWSW